MAELTKKYEAKDVEEKWYAQWMEFRIGKDLPGRNLPPPNNFLHRVYLAVRR